MHNIKIKNLCGAFAGFVMIVLMSAAFSGYSLNIKYISDVVCRIFYENSPMPYVSMAFSDKSSRAEVVCSYFYNSISPYSSVISEAAYNYKGNIMLGDNQAKIGDNNYILKKAISENEAVSGDVNVIYGDEYNENMAVSGSAITASAPVKDESHMVNELKNNMSTDFLLKNFYIVDSTTSVKKSIFNVKKMLKRDYSIEKKKEPQILIYHTHAASESFAGSKPGDMNEGVLGVGDYLTEVLSDTYGYNVYHDRTAYDMINGKIDRSLAYAKALPSISQILRDNPSIEVIIDLHRDGISGNTHTVTNIGGKKTAKVMFFNGISRSSTGPRKYLQNNNLTDNLSFSLQLKLKAMEMYPDFAKPIYIKGYRYNLHLAKRCLLIELGNQNNTFEEAKNAMLPLADVLNSVLSGE